MGKIISIKERPLFILNLLLVIFAICYYLFFAPRGLVLSDEGYYVHYAQRIANGEIPYKDFLLQYTPGYFYLLAILYKFFGTQIILGRLLSLSICILILISTQLLLRLYKITSRKMHFLSSLVIISLGYPLLHLPLVIWPSVLIAVLLEISFLYWENTKRNSILFILGFLLALALFFRQHVGLFFLILFNLIVFLSCPGKLKNKILSVLILDFSWVFFTFVWVYLLFFASNNLSGVLTLFEYNRQYISTYPFSYPPLTILLQPTGIFKLLPYYFPLIFGLTVFISIIRERVDWRKLSLVFVVLCGFAITIYPASDLLHVYPFLGLIITSSLIYFQKRKEFYYFQVTAVVFIFLGIYLTFFTKSYRYEDPFLKQNTRLNLPSTNQILINKNNPAKTNLVGVYRFINSHSKKGDYIFVYPFAPMMYTLLDRRNPNQIVQFDSFQAAKKIYPDARVLSEIKMYKVKYIVTDESYMNYHDSIADFVARQTKVANIGPYIIFEVRQ